MTFSHWHHCHWCWCHMMQTVLSLVPLHSLGEDNSNEVQHHVFGHLTPMVLAPTLCYANSIPWVKLIKKRYNITFLVMWPNNVVYMLTPHCCTNKSKKKQNKKPTKLQLNFHLINIHVPKANMTLKCQRYPAYANYFMCTWDNYVSIYTSYVTVAGVYFMHSTANLVHMMPRD